MARRMYDLDNGTENIKVKEIVANKITAVTSAITSESDALTVFGPLTIGHGHHVLSSSGGAHLGGFVLFPSYSSANRPTISGQVGSVIYDSDLAKLILYNGTAWVNLDGSSLGE